MRGLIYRNFKINKKSFLCSVILCIGMIYTLLEEITNTEKEFMMYINAVTFLSIIVIYSIAEYIYNLDNEEKWEKFLKASPLSNRIIIGEKFVYDFIFITLGVIVASVIIFFVCDNSKYNMNYDFWVGIIIAIMITFIYASIKKILICICGKKKAEIVAVIFLMLGIALAFMFVIIINVEWIEKINIEWFYSFILSKKCLLLVPISIFMHYCAYKICCKIYK